MGEQGNKRCPCPFYGFALRGEVLIDTGGNQCAVTGGYIPCYMERDGARPNWLECAWINGHDKSGATGHINRLRKRGQVFPEEDKPADATTWAGIPFEEWWQRVLALAAQETQQTA